MNKKYEDVSCLILAGGESKRFGENKALFDYNGFTFIGRALNTALDVSADVVISVREKAQEEEYNIAIEKIVNERHKKNKRKEYNIRLIPDDAGCGLKGPAKGIFSSIGSLSGEFVFVMECDAPFFDAEVVKALIDKAKAEDVVVVAPLWPDSVVEPLLAYYAREDVARILTMLNDYSLSLKQDFLFNDAMNILRLLPSAYYYSISDMIKDRPNLSSRAFININDKKELEKITSDERLFSAYPRHSLKRNAESVKIKKTNRFYDIKNPKDVPSGILAEAFYFWWVYSKTKNYMYLKKSFDFFKKDSSLYFANGLNFMADKIVRLLPDPYNIGCDIKVTDNRK